MAPEPDSQAVYIEMHGASAILVNDIDTVGGVEVGPELGQVLTIFR